MKRSSLLKIVSVVASYLLLFLGIFQDDVSLIILAGIFLIQNSINDLANVVRSSETKRLDE